MRDCETPGHTAARPLGTGRSRLDPTILNRAIRLFLVLAAIVLVAAKPQDPAAIVWSNGDDGSIVPEERAVLAKFVARYAVSPTGHITAVDVDANAGKNPHELDLNSLSALGDLETLIVFQAPVRPHATDVAPEQSQDLKSAATAPGSVEHHADNATAGPAHPNGGGDADDPFGPPPASPRGSKEPPSKSSAKSTKAVPNPPGAAGAPQETDLDDNPNDPFTPPGYKPPQRPPRAALPPIIGKLRRLGWSVIMDQRDDTVHISDYRGDTLSDDEMVALAALPNLASLKLRKVPTSHRVIEALAKSPKFDSLSLRGASVSDEDVKMIARLPKLRSLDLSLTNVGSAGVAFLKGHPALRELNLELTPVGNAAMKALSGNENLTSLNVSGTRVDDAGLVYIGKFRHLRSLSINAGISNDALAAIEGLVELEEFWGPVKINDVGLHHLRNMTNMRQLRVGSRLFTDDGLRSIRGLTRLEELNLDRSKITDKGMEFVKEMHGLKWLRLYGTKVTDAGMKPVANLKHLRLLDCRLMEIGDAALVPISTLPELGCLELGDTRVTSAGMRSLTKLAALRSLDLMGTPVGDEGMTYIAKLPELETLNISATKVGDAGLEKLAGTTSLQNVIARDTKATESGVSLLRQRKISVTYTQVSPEPPTAIAPVVP